MLVDVLMEAMTMSASVAIMTMNLATLLRWNAVVPVLLISIAVHPSWRGRGSASTTATLLHAVLVWPDGNHLSTPSIAAHFASYTSPATNYHRRHAARISTARTSVAMITAEMISGEMTSVERIFVETTSVNHFLPLVACRLHDVVQRNMTTSR
jgi:hypothetical protein